MCHLPQPFHHQISQITSTQAGTVTIPREAPSNDGFIKCAKRPRHSGSHRPIGGGGRDRCAARKKPRGRRTERGMRAESPSAPSLSRPGPQTSRGSLVGRRAQLRARESAARDAPNAPGSVARRKRRVGAQVRRSLAGQCGGCRCLSPAHREKDMFAQPRRD